MFRLMAENGKRYGFPNMVEEFSFCIKGLWEHASTYFNTLSTHPPHAWLHKLPENLIFYNNFEISHRSVWLDKGMAAWLDHIDRLGGIYYHRWGDAPIHTLGVAMFVPLRQVYRFSGIGYSHWPFVQQATAQNDGDGWGGAHHRVAPSRRWQGFARPVSTAPSNLSSSRRFPEYSIDAGQDDELQQLFAVRPVGWQGVGQNSCRLFTQHAPQMIESSCA